jgi:hypothetical protein
VTKSVTPTDVLVLSPEQVPDDPKDVPEVFDAFARTLVALQAGMLAGRWEDGRLLLTHR